MNKKVYTDMKLLIKIYRTYRTTLKSYGRKKMNIKIKNLLYCMRYFTNNNEHILNIPRAQLHNFLIPLNIKHDVMQNL
jgi:hypothetical protein